MKILITGSGGLIGTALKQQLRSFGVQVIGFDHKFDQDHPEYGDILNRDGLYESVQGVDGVIHFAAVSRVIFAEQDPELCVKTNVGGTENVVDAALSCAKKPFVIYASSREVYGQQDVCPVAEDAAYRPVNIYGESKIKAEGIVNGARSKGLVTSVVRFSNVYGSILDHHDRVVPAFCRAAALGTDIRVDGKNNLFDFTYIDDVVQGLIPLIRLLIDKQVVPPIHFTGGKPSSLEEIALIAKEASDHDLKIVEAPSRSFDVATFWGDTSRADNLLGWRAQVGIKDGMTRLINQYRLFLHDKVQQEALTD